MYPLIVLLNINHSVEGLILLRFLLPLSFLPLLCYAILCYLSYFSAFPTNIPYFSMFCRTLTLAFLGVDFCSCIYYFLSFHLSGEGMILTIFFTLSFLFFLHHFFGIFLPLYLNTSSRYALKSSKYSYLSLSCRFTFVLSFLVPLVLIIHVKEFFLLCSLLSSVLCKPSVLIPRLCPVFS